MHNRASNPTGSIRTRHSLAAATLRAVLFLCACSSALPARAALKQVRLHVDGKDVAVRRSCLWDGHEVYVPLESLTAFGLTWQLTQHADSALVTRAGHRSPVEIALARPDGEWMAPVSAVSGMLGLDWSVKDGACIVGPRGSPPAPSSRASTPSSTPVQRADSPDASQRNAQQPVAERRSSPVQPAQPVPGGAAAGLPDARLKVPAAAPPPAAAPAAPPPPALADQQPAAPPSPAAPATGPAAADAVPPPAPEAVPPGVTRITDVDFLPIDDGHAQVVLRGTSKLKASVVMMMNPSRIAIDVPHAVVDAGQTDWPVKHPFLTDIRSVAESGETARIVLDLAKLVSYRIVRGADTVTVQLGLPKGAGRHMQDLIVAIDPGHGGPKTGCSAVIGGKRIYEKNLTLSIAKLTAAAFEEAGAHVVMTRTDDSDVGLKERPAIAAAHSADVFISIHIDDCPGCESASGTTVYYHGYDADSRSLAISLSGRIGKVSGLPVRGAVSDFRRFVTGMAVLRYSVMPAVLIEVGYISNPYDRSKIINHDFQVQIAQAIVDGVRGYVESSLPDQPLSPVEAWTR